MHVDDNRLTIEYFGTRTWVEPYGPDTFRVRQSLSRHMPGTTDALLSPEPTAIDAEVGDKEAVLINGCLKVVVNHKGGTRFYRISDGEDIPLCANQKNEFRPKTSDTFELVSNFEAYDDEKIYGMGQYEHGYLDQKGCTLDLHQINREISIPFFISSRKYGFLWHNPALGHVEFAANRTRWQDYVDRHPAADPRLGFSSRHMRFHHRACSGNAALGGRFLAV